MRADAVRNHRALVAAARTAFEAEGPDVALDEVARRAGVGPSTLYRRFAGRDELVAAVVEEYLAERVEPLLARAAAVGDPWTALVGVLEGMVDSVTGYRVALHAARVAGVFTPEVVARVIGPLDGLVRRAQAAEESQRVLHNCVQGWSSIGEWAGLPLHVLLDHVRPMPEARYLCVLSMQDNGRDEPSADGAGRFFEVIDLELARQSHTLLAYGMNGGALPIKHGAPLRLRIENQVGFKMVKWLKGVEFVEHFSDVGAGLGGYNNDHEFFGYSQSI